MNCDVYGVGNALVDIQASVADAVLGELGFQKGIMTLIDEAMQRRVLEFLRSSRFTQCAGGSAANTVIAVAELGGSAAYSAKVGDDQLGDFFLSDMRNLGVKVPTPPALGPTGTSVILISPDAQRTMLTHLGINAELTIDDLDESQIGRAKYVYIEGYLFGGSPTQKAAARQAMHLAKQKGVRVAFTVSDPFLIANNRDEFWNLIRGPIDLLFCNLEEARSLTGLHDPIDCASQIHHHAENVALTLGADGAILMHEGQTIPIGGVPCDAVDTTGAGDMFAGALMYGITNGMTWPQAGRLASTAASRIVAQIGARLQTRLTRAEIDAFRS